MEQYQPGLHKFIYHPEHIVKMRRGEYVGPLHISVWPTPRCQAKCSYCSMRNANLHGQTDELEPTALLKCLHRLQQIGLLAVEFSGGGDPLLWEPLPYVVQELHGRGLKLSLITNGYALSSVDSATINRFDWIRVSLHSVGHAMDIDWNVHPQISASYMVGDDTPGNLVEHIQGYCTDKRITLRIGAVQPASVALVERIRGLVREPTFFTFKPFGTPRGCYMAWVRAGIDWRGNFMACPGKQLTPESTGFIPDDFGLCKMENIDEWLFQHHPHDLGFRCSLCSCGKEINDYLHCILNEEIPNDAEFV